MLPQHRQLASGRIPTADTGSELDQELVTSALDYMKLRADAPIKGTPIQVAFMSCTNGRLGDFEAVADVIKDIRLRPTFEPLLFLALKKWMPQPSLGLHEVFEAAGFEWRKPGCSCVLP